MPVRLPPNVQPLWEAYAEADQHNATRPEAPARLAAFIDAVLRLPTDDWHVWGLSVAAENVDRRGGIRLRQPLFERVIFPALLVGLDAGWADCARWLGGLAQDLYRCPSCRAQLGQGRNHAAALFRLALCLNPTDGDARRRLIRVLAERFKYALHEVPAGVLFGHNGATPAECELLQADLREFEALLTTAGSAADYADLLAECRFHFTAYSAYLNERPRLPSYADYIARVGGVPTVRE